MIVAVETLFLTALLSAFIGAIALFALASPQARRSPRAQGALTALVVAASVAALGSFFIYAVSPHEAARQAVYSGVAPQPAPRGL
jgi:ABC-type Fe3+-siderophore transport system permease subunit